MYTRTVPETLEVMVLLFPKAQHHLAPPTAARSLPTDGLQFQPHVMSYILNFSSLLNNE